MALELKKKPSKKAHSAKDEPVKLSKKAQAELDKPFVAELPLVNMLPGDVLEVVEQQRLKRLFVLLAVGVVAAIGAAYLAQSGVIAVAENKLADEQAKTAPLLAQQAELAPVKTFYEQIEANKSTIQTTMAREVLTSQVLADLSAVTPGGVDITSTGVALEAAAPVAAGAVADPTQTTNTCPSQDPYNTSGLSAGCVTVDGTATSREVLGDWLDSIDESETFTVAFIPSTSTGGETGGVTFSATIGLSDTVYLNRYAEIFQEGAN